MIRRINPTRIELKKTDLEEYERKVQETATNNDQLNMSREPLPLNADERKAAVNRRIGFEPETVPSDGATNVHF